MEEVDVFKINDDELFKHSVINGFRNTSLHVTISRNYVKLNVMHGTLHLLVPYGR